MKRIILSVLALAAAGVAAAQEERSEYMPFVEEGKAWYCGYNHPGVSFPKTPEDSEGLGIDCVFIMHGDSLIGDREYKKVYCQFEEYYGDKEQHYYSAVREEACQVFIVEEKTAEEKLIYDFSRPGQIITVTYNEYKFARTGGFRRYGFLPGQLEYSVCKFSGDEVDYSNDSSFWIDGVGAPYNNPFAFELCFLPFDEQKLSKDIYVLSCMKDGKYLYELKWMAEPIEPTSIDDDSHIDNIHIVPSPYDLLGRKIIGKPTYGLYISQGRKVLVK